MIYIYIYIYICPLLSEGFCCGIPSFTRLVSLVASPCKCPLPHPQSPQAQRGGDDLRSPSSALRVRCRAGAAQEAGTTAYGVLETYGLGIMGLKVYMSLHGRLRTHPFVLLCSLGSL